MTVYEGIWGYMRYMGVYGGIWRYMKVYEGIWSIWKYMGYKRIYGAYEGFLFFDCLFFIFETSI